MCQRCLDCIHLYISDQLKVCEKGRHIVRRHVFHQFFFDQRWPGIGLWSVLSCGAYRRFSCAKLAVIHDARYTSHHMINQMQDAPFLECFLYSVQFLLFCLDISNPTFSVCFALEMEGFCTEDISLRLTENIQRDVARKKKVLQWSRKCCNTCKPAWNMRFLLPILSRRRYENKIQTVEQCWARPLLDLKPMPNNEV